MPGGVLGRSKGIWRTRHRPSRHQASFEVGVITKPLIRLAHIIVIIRVLAVVWSDVFEGIHNAAFLHRHSGNEAMEARENEGEDVGSVGHTAQFTRLP